MKLKSYYLSVVVTILLYLSKFERAQALPLGDASSALASNDALNASEINKSVRLAAISSALVGLIDSINEFVNSSDTVLESYGNIDIQDLPPLTLPSDDSDSALIDTLHLVKRAIGVPDLGATKFMLQPVALSSRSVNSVIKPTSNLAVDGLPQWYTQGVAPIGLKPNILSKNPFDDFPQIQSGFNQPRQPAVTASGAAAKPVSPNLAPTSRAATLSVSQKSGQQGVLLDKKPASQTLTSSQVSAKPNLASTNKLKSSLEANIKEVDTASQRGSHFSSNDMVTYRSRSAQFERVRGYVEVGVQRVMQKRREVLDGKLGTAPRIVLEKTEEALQGFISNKIIAALTIAIAGGVSAAAIVQTQNSTVSKTSNETASPTNVTVLGAASELETLPEEHSQLANEYTNDDKDVDYYSNDQSIDDYDFDPSTNTIDDGENGDANYLIDDEADSTSFSKKLQSLLKKSRADMASLTKRELTDAFLGSNSVVPDFTDGIEKAIKKTDLCSDIESVTQTFSKILGGSSGLVASLGDLLNDFGATVFQSLSRSDNDQVWNLYSASKDSLSIMFSGIKDSQIQTIKDSMSSGAALVLQDLLCES